MTICGSGIAVSGIFRVEIEEVSDIKGRPLKKSSSSSIMVERISSSDPR